MVFNPLYIVWNFNPVLFSVGGLDIRYYGLMWALAILVGAKFFDNFCKREGLPSSVSESIFIYGTLAKIIGSSAGDHHRNPKWRYGEPRCGRGASDRVVALFAPEQTALHLVARPHHDPCGDRRCGGALR